MLIDCFSCVKWNNVYSAYFAVIFGVRQGSVLAPFLFAVYLNELSDIFLHRSQSINSDDILLISLSVVDLEKMFHLCECELNYLDMGINYKKSCCLPIGLRCDVSCGNITMQLNWQCSPVVIRYLGFFIVKSRIFQCLIDEANVTFIVLLMLSLVK